MLHVPACACPLSRSSFDVSLGPNAERVWSYNNSIHLFHISNRSKFITFVGFFLLFIVVITVVASNIYTGLNALTLDAIIRYVCVFVCVCSLQQSNGPKTRPEWRTGEIWVSFSIFILSLAHKYWYLRYESGSAWSFYNHCCHCLFPWSSFDYALIFLANNLHGAISPLIVHLFDGM